MGKLTRRGLVGVAGMLAVAPLLPESTQAQEQWPPEGYTFCGGCAGEDWDVRFGADILRRREAGGPLYDVYLNEQKTMDAMALKTGPNGWVADAVRVWEQDEDGWYSHYTLCDCGMNPDLQMRITYGRVSAVKVEL